VAAKRGWPPYRDKNNTKLLIGTWNSGHLVGVSFSELLHNRGWTVNISARFGGIQCVTVGGFGRAIALILTGRIPRQNIDGQTNTPEIRRF